MSSDSVREELLGSLLGALDEDQQQALESRLDREPALRYWAAIGLGNSARSELLRPLLKDSSAVVRIAAARGLKDVAALAAELKSTDEWTRLEAAIVLDEMRQGAALKPALQDKNNYVQRVANHAQG